MVAVRCQLPVVVAIKRARVVHHRLPRRRSLLDLVRQRAAKPAEEAIRVRDRGTDLRGIGAVREVELGRDQLVGQDQAGVARDRCVQNRQQVRLSIGLAP